MTIPSSVPHHSPRNQPDSNLSAPGGGGVSQPSRYSHNALNQVNALISHPRKSRRKKNRAVGRSMQKNAQPRFTDTNVSAHATAVPNREDGPTSGPRTAFHARWIVNSTPCHRPQQMKLSPVPQSADRHRDQHIQVNPRRTRA